MQLKVHRTFDEQIALLKSRGMVIQDDLSAKATLQRIGYYRLAGYWYPLRQTNPIGIPGRPDEFQKESCFDTVEALYEFDKKLRLIVLDAIERIEVAIRVDIAYLLGKQHPLAHQRPGCLDNKFFTKISKRTGQTQFQEWSNKLTAAVNSSKEDFVFHHRNKYDGQMPIWVVVEVWDFGMLSKFFAGMKFRDQREIAKRYGIPDGQFLASWLRTLNFARNVSAHHSRLWNRNVPEVPKLIAKEQNFLLRHLYDDTQSIRRVYGMLCLIQYLLRTISPNCDWSEQLKSLCNAFPENQILNLKSAGFPDKWKELPLWN